MSIFEEFKNITGLALPVRQTNYLSDCIERKDLLFQQLAILYFSNRQKFRGLLHKIGNWVKNGRSETIFAMAGYTYYITEDFNLAKKYFLKAISLNPNNLDNWIDLAFTLRHLGEYNVSNGILFNYNYAIYYYKYLELDRCGYPKLKSLILEIKKRAGELKENNFNI